MPGQIFGDFAAQLRKIGDKADLQLLTMEDLYVYRYIVGAHDYLLYKKFSKLNLPLLKSSKRFTMHMRSLKESSSHCTERMQKNRSSLHAAAKTTAQVVRNSSTRKVIASSSTAKKSKGREL